MSVIGRDKDSNIIFFTNGEYNPYYTNCDVDLYLTKLENKNIWEISDESVLSLFLAGLSPAVDINLSVLNKLTKLEVMPYLSSNFENVFNLNVLNIDFYKEPKKLLLNSQDIIFIRNFAFNNFEFLKSITSYLKNGGKSLIEIEHGKHNFELPESISNNNTIEILHSNSKRTLLKLYKE